jgi:hypothetical protein
MYSVLKGPNSKCDSGADYLGNLHVLKQSLGRLGVIRRFRSGTLDSEIFRKMVGEEEKRLELSTGGR